MTRSRVSGRSRMRAPSACATALPIAATVGPPLASPTPSGGRSAAGLTSSTSDLGHLAEAQHRIALPVARADAGRCRAARLPSSAQLAAWMMPPSSWLMRAVRVDDEPGIGGAPDAQQPDALVDLDLGDDGGVGGEVLVAGEADAAAASGAGRQPGLPVGQAARRARRPRGPADRTGPTAGRRPGPARPARPVRP